ncbi:MAG: glycoside hydrolase family 13 protein [Promicromonosporaceae bacterium]|nr:glycoside hydrolase family 13 protein [Promicromonosporaceae bacterium]
MTLLLQPYHDGSAAHVTPGVYDEGDVISVKVRVPHAAGVKGVWLRTVRDGEPRLVRARLKRPGEHQDTYVADLVFHNQPTEYRFLLETPAIPGGYQWLNGQGVHSREVGDAADFRVTAAPSPPAWLTAGTAYQIFPDRFARSAAADHRPLPDWATPLPWGAEPAPLPPLTARQVAGGDLDGVIEHLDHLVDLHVQTLYLTPFFPGRSNHRYDASTFHSVAPLLGGDAALARLTAAAHARGLKVMGDLTTNHCGVAHEWFQRALNYPTSPEHNLFLWAGADGVPAQGADIHPKYMPGYVSWLGHHSLPKLDWRSEYVRRAMITGEDSAMAHWLKAPYRLDGWRVDVANMTGRYARHDQTVEISRLFRQTMSGLNPEAAVIAEHFFDYASDLPGDGWHAAMNYAGFSRPVWAWLGDPTTNNPQHFGLPIAFQRITGQAMVAAMRDFFARVPWQVAAAQWNNIGSHDTPRVRTRLGSAANVELAATLMFTYLGTPMMFQGDEGGATGSNGEHSRTCMPWEQIPSGGAAWETDTHAVFRGLSRLRAGRSALATGGLRWAIAADDALAYLRECEGERLLVVVARDEWAGETLPKWVLGTEPPELLYGGQVAGTPQLTVTGDGLRLAADGPAVGVWRLA